MCTESEGAERASQHQLFYPRTKALHFSVVPLWKEPENTWLVSSAGGFTFSFLQLINLSAQCWETDEDVVLLPFLIHPTLQLDPPLSWLRDIFIPALGLYNVQCSIVVTQSPALEPIPGVKMTVQIIHCPRGTNQYSDNINSHITIVSFEGL